MRYPAGHKERTRRRIVTTAARCFREKGFAGAGVDDVMKGAGLTAGGFYAHFASKKTLLRESLAEGTRQTRERLFVGLDDADGLEWMTAVVQRYLSRTHRDSVGEGCTLPALAAEVSRQGRRAREAFEAYFQGLAAELAQKAPALPGLPSEDRALSSLALFAGGLMLARAVRDPALSDRILRACRRLALPEASPAREGARS